MLKAYTFEEVKKDFPEDVCLSQELSLSCVVKKMVSDEVDNSDKKLVPLTEAQSDGDDEDILNYGDYCASRNHHQFHI